MSDERRKRGTMSNERQAFFVQRSVLRVQRFVGCPVGTSDERWILLPAGHPTGEHSCWRFGLVCLRRSSLSTSRSALRVITLPAADFLSSTTRCWAGRPWLFLP